MNEYDFNKISLYPDGLNAQSADIDFYDATQKSMGKFDVKIELSSPLYFRSNSWLLTANKWFTEHVRGPFIQALDIITSNLLDFKTNQRGTLIQLMENLKN